MARTVEEIFEYLDNKESVIGNFLTLTQYDTFSKYMPLDTEISSVDEAVVNEGYVVVPETIRNMRTRAQKILDDLNNEFKEALSNVDDDKKDALIAEYNEKKKIANDGVEMINAYCDKMTNNWERFRSGEVITYDDKYSITNDFVNNAKSDVAREDDEQNQENPQQEEGDLSVEDSKSVLQLLKELREARAARRKLERALVAKRFKDFGESIEESGAAYLKSQEATAGYKAKIQELKNKYKASDAKIDQEEAKLEDTIDVDRAELATSKGELHILRQKPIINYLEKAIKAKEKLEKRLEEASDEERAILEDKLENAEATISRIYETPDGKKYAELQSDIRFRKANIRINKENIKHITEERIKLDDWFKEAKNKAKAEKTNMLPEKQSKFKMFIGAIRAKLGIGKHKAEKNAKDSIENMITSAGDFLSRVGTGITEKAGQAKDSVKDFVAGRVESAISKLEQHINNRISKEQQKAQDIQGKINPEGESR